MKTTKEPWKGSLRSKRLPSNWTVLRRAVLTRDAGVCKLRYPGCLNVATEVDHILQGDDHSLKNLQAVCSNCHKIKTNRDRVNLLASRRKLRYRPDVRHPGSRM